MTVAVGVTVTGTAMGLMLAVALCVPPGWLVSVPLVPGVLLLRTGCTGADCRGCEEAGEERGRMLAVRTLSAVLELWD